MILKKMLLGGVSMNLKAVSLGLALVVGCSLMVGCGDDKKQNDKPVKKVEKKVEKTEPKEETKAEPKIEPKEEAKVEPKEEAKVEPKEEPKVEQKAEREYTALQKAFLEINKDMKGKDIEAIANNYNLPYSKVKYSDSYTYQLAFTKDATAQKYNKTHEDYLSVSFGGRSHYMQNCIYHCDATSKSAMLYVYGYYYELSEKTLNNSLVGYYYSDPMKKEGIEIRGKKTSYVPMSDAKEALEKALTD